MYLHRLWAIGEEGRMTLQRVTASPIVSQGGECMSSFYDEKGTMVLACSGHLRFAAATSDAIRDLMHRFEKSPGFFDGDQFFFNDPYVAGSHTYDMMIVKPIFYRGELIAWTATSTHTADTGGLLRGAAQEIFHEGICVPGLKIVEKPCRSRPCRCRVRATRWRPARAARRPSAGPRPRRAAAARSSRDASGPAFRRPVRSARRRENDRRF